MPGALEEDGWHAGSPEVRARDLQAAFADPEIDAIQTMRGGYGSAQVIPLLDFDAIAETPKPFVGLSDITALHAALLARGRLATFYGPSLTMFGDPSPSPLTTDRFLQVLAGETTGPVPEDRDRLTVISIAGGKANGPLVGGCLVDFIYTIGTPWEPELDGTIFFFEECNSAPIRIDRSLLYLEQSGKLEGVRGIVVGELAGCEWYEHTSAPRSKTLENRARGPPRWARRPGALRAAPGARREPRDASAGRRSDSRRGRADAHDRRARTPDSVTEAGAVLGL
jgi:muramoyltetrapeptide carboxypeptidase